MRISEDQTPKRLRGSRSKILRKIGRFGINISGWTIKGKIPDEERNLLVHHNDMTSTLSKFHDSDLYIEVLNNQFNDNYLLRMVVLKKTKDNKPVEFGAIGINLSSLDNSMVNEINVGRKPLGKLLEQYSVNYMSNPRAYFEIEIDDYISKILCSEIGTITYGRCNEITDSQGFTIADIVEVLPKRN